MRVLFSYCYSFRRRYRFCGNATRTRVGYYKLQFIVFPAYSPVAVRRSRIYCFAQLASLLLQSGMEPKSEDGKQAGLCTNFPSESNDGYGMAKTSSAISGLFSFICLLSIFSLFSSFYGYVRMLEGSRG